MKVMFVGDICLGEYYTSFGHGPRSYAESNYIFENVKEAFDAADLVVGNLEAPITNRNYDPTDPAKVALKADPAHAPQLKKAGFRVMQVANNHIVQHADGGFEDSLETLKELGISAVGLNNESPVIVEIEGTRLGFLAASDVPDNTDASQTKYQRLDEQFLKKVEEEVANVDHLIVLLHWGLENSTVPLPYQRELAARLKKAGVRAIVGCHPHLFYEVEYSPEFVCAYSLGNFVFDLCWDDRLIKSGILELDFADGGLTGCLWPVEIKENGCLPTITGKPETLSNRTTLYHLNPGMALQQIKKIAYLLRNLGKGDTRLKLKFFAQKVIGHFGS